VSRPTDSRGRVSAADERRAGGLVPSLDYQLYRPAGGLPPERVLVTVHGVSRNAEEHITLFRPWADRYRVLLLAPHFSRERFRDYQRLGRKGMGPRADLALIRVLNEVAAQTGCDTSRVDLFGYSGGAQFAHRFAFAHPHRVHHVGLGAAGWYTLPDPTQRYPYGIADVGGLDHIRFNARAIARLPVFVAVGELDNRDDDEELNQTRRIRASQGHNRLRRAHVWIEQMNALARRHGDTTRADIAVMPRVGHSFAQSVNDGGLAAMLFERFYGAPVVPRRAQQGVCVVRPAGRHAGAGAEDSDAAARAVNDKR
jgi:pimeloyl-ACP methyl ester carboxylesterase